MCFSKCALKLFILLIVDILYIFFIKINREECQIADDLWVWWYQS